MKKLKAIISVLNSVGLKKEAIAIKNLLQNYSKDPIYEGNKEIRKVLAHIDGPSGVGKTALMGKLEYFGFSTVDLDNFDSVAAGVFGLPAGWRSSSVFSNELLKQVHQTRSDLLSNFIKSEIPQKTILLGIHIEGDTRYDIEADYKILMVDDIGKIVEKRMKRDHLAEKERPKIEKETIEYIQKLKDLGYASMTKDEIIKFFRHKI
jgi:hypothetical protein